MFHRLVRLLPLKWVDYLMQRKAGDLAFMKKTLVETDPNDFENISERKALQSFSRALRIPAYRAFLRRKKVNVNAIRSFSDFLKKVPVSTKKNYVKRAKDLKSRSVDGDLDACGFLARSSGYSGKSTTWGKSRKELEASKHFASAALDLFYNVTKKKTLVIDSFALGSWVSGVDLLYVMNGHTTIIAPGADIDESLSVFQDLYSEFDQVIIASTPHFMKAMVEEGVRRRVPFKKTTVHLILSAEAFPEEWRVHMHTLLGGRKQKGTIYSAFGSSDLGVTGVNETKNSSALRALCLKNKKLRKEIYGKYSEILPHLFQYDPTKFLIETNEKQELIFTNCDQHALMPLIRYNIHDIGYVFRHDEMKEILKECGIRMRLEMPLPFVFVVGRSDGTVNFIGQLIYPEYIHKVLYSRQELRKLVTGIFKLRKEYDKNHNPFLHVDLHLQKGVSKSKKIERMFHHAVERFFLDLSSDFGVHFDLLQKKTKKHPLVVNIFEHDKYPHNDGIKVKYL